MTRVSLVVADGHLRQQAAVDEWLADHPAGVRAVVAEGLFQPLTVPTDIVTSQVAAGCVCCAGQVLLRVTLLRILRMARPQDLLLVVGSATHLGRLRALLADGSLGARFDVSG